MFNNQAMHICLDGFVGLNNASKWSSQYLTEGMLANALPDSEPLSPQLKRILNGSIDKVLYSVINQKKINETVKTVLDEFQFYEGKADYSELNPNAGRFVGIQFEMKANQDLAVVINKVSLQIDNACPDLKLYLYSDDDVAPLAVIDTPYTFSRAVQWFDTGLKLTNGNTNYYLGYYEDDLPNGAQSIRKKINYVDGSGCKSCGTNEAVRRNFATRSKYMTTQPFYIHAEHLNDRDLPDLRYISEVDNNNYGINIHATIGCDITAFLCRNKYLLGEPIALQYAIDLLNAIMTSLRDNSRLEKSKAEIAYLLNGSTDQRGGGLNYELKKMIDALSIDLSGLNKVCLPCVNKATMSYRGLR